MVLRNRSTAVTAPRRAAFAALAHGISVDALLVAEAAFAVMLLVAACLMARSFVRLIQVEPGYVTDGVLTARVLMPQGTPAERTTAFVDTVLARARAIPGVVAAGAGNMMPMVAITAVATFTLPADDPSTSGPVTVRAAAYSITPGYAEALGLRLRQGRLLDERDAHAAAPRALVVNDEFVRRYLSGTKQSPVGYRFSAGLMLDEAPILTEIVGVVGNVLKDGHDRQPQPEIYFSQASRGRRIERAINLVIRTSNDAVALDGADAGGPSDPSRGRSWRQYRADRTACRSSVGVRRASAIRGGGARDVRGCRVDARVGRVVRRAVVFRLAAPARVRRPRRARRIAARAGDARAA